MIWVLVPVQIMDPYEHFRPFLLVSVQTMDLYEHWDSHLSGCVVGVVFSLLIQVFLLLSDVGIMGRRELFHLPDVFQKVRDFGGLVYIDNKSALFG